MRPWRFRKYSGDSDIAIDFGTANTRLYVLGRGVVADEPTRVAAVDVDSPCGTVALRARGERSGQLVAPLRAGVVSDIDAAARFLGDLMRRACGQGFLRANAIVCAPSDASPAERSHLVEAVRRTGIGRVKVLPEPFASAIGAGLDVNSPYGQILIDIGDGVTDIAVIRSRELVVTRAVRRAASDLRAALQQTVLQRSKLFLPWREAERLFRDSAVIDETISSPTFSILAFDRGGAPVRMNLRSQDVFEAVHPIVMGIADRIRQTLNQLPHDLGVEVIESGIMLSGGGACLRGIDRLIARETSVDVRVAARPLRATIDGAGEILAAAREAGLWETFWDASNGFGSR